PRLPQAHEPAPVSEHRDTRTGTRRPHQGSAPPARRAAGLDLFTSPLRGEVDRAKRGRVRGSCGEILLGDPPHPAPSAARASPTSPQWGRGGRVVLSPACAGNVPPQPTSP